MICPCVQKKTLPDQAPYCAYCGLAVPPAPVLPVPPRRRGRWARLVLGGVLVLVVGLVVGRRGRGPEVLPQDTTALVTALVTAQRELTQAQDKVKQEEGRLQAERQALEQQKQEVAAARKAPPPPAPASPTTADTGSGKDIATTVKPPPPQLLPEKTWRSPSTGIEFVMIQSGTFMMGSKTGSDDEKPVHEVRLSKAFYLGKYEVTQEEWAKVMGTNPSQFPGDPRRPVENVSWNDTQDFIRKLNAKESGAKYRLPTEAEWEYAARAGSTTAYSFGDDVGKLGDYAWHGQNAGNATHPVGQKQPNPWGLYL